MAAVVRTAVGAEVGEVWSGGGGGGGGDFQVVIAAVGLCCGLIFIMWSSREIKFDLDCPFLGGEV